MYGAILGDIIGSRFEFDRGGLSKVFKLLTDSCEWTDDTVMTVAIAEALMDAGTDATPSEIETACIKSMQKWGQKYPYAGYGSSFIYWVSSKDPKPYGSYGNGSAMRVSPAGWMYYSIEQTRAAARATANVSHNHPEGIKGAECTAAVIYLARTGHTKKYIQEYVISEFGYDFSETLSQMRKRHSHVETCMDSMPKALRSFFDGTSYEDVVRNAVSLGGDTDTLAAIAGAMAEAFYGMPADLIAECRYRVEKDMLEVIDRFDKYVGRGKSRESDDGYLNDLYKRFVNEKDEDARVEAFKMFLERLCEDMVDNRCVPMPFVDVNNILLGSIDVDNVQAGDTFQVKEDVRLRMDTMTDVNENQWLPLFLSKEEMEKGETANIIMSVEILDLFKIGLERDDLMGIVIDPFSEPFTLDKEMIKYVLAEYKYCKAHTDDETGFDE